ncbi:MAG TPA: hypothetical protein VNS58_06750 [Puia sp.]|nr:hypothetical protein [Puia sp.]
MDKEKLVEYLKDIPKPAPTESQYQKTLKISLLTARKSSRIGFWLIALPGIVVLLFIIQNLFHLNPGFSRWIGKNTSSLSTPARAVLVFVFLVGFPLLAIVLNLLSVCYFQYDKIRREFNISFKIRWWNIVITLIGGALASFYILHLLADTLLSGK